MIRVIVLLQWNSFCCMVAHPTRYMERSRVVDRPFTFPSMANITIRSTTTRVRDNAITRPCLVGSVGSVSASRTVGREFASRPGHTKDRHKNGTNCLPAWHAMR